MSCIAWVIWKLHKSQDRDFMVYECEMDHSIAKGTKNICCANRKDEEDQTRLGRPNTVFFKVVLKTSEANLVSSTRRVSDELGILQFNVLHHFQDYLSKSTQIWYTVPYITKILQNFYLTPVIKQVILFYRKDW